MTALAAEERRLEGEIRGVVAGACPFYIPPPFIPPPQKQERKKERKKQEKGGQSADEEEEKRFSTRGVRY